MQGTQYKDTERQSWQQIRLLLGSVKQLWPKHPAPLLSHLSCETWRTIRANQHRISQNSSSGPSMGLSVQGARERPGQVLFCFVFQEICLIKDVLCRKSHLVHVSVHDHFSHKIPATVDVLFVTNGISSDLVSRQGHVLLPRCFTPPEP